MSRMPLVSPAPKMLSKNYSHDEFSFAPVCRRKWNRDKRVSGASEATRYPKVSILSKLANDDSIIPARTFDSLLFYNYYFR